MSKFELDPSYKQVPERIADFKALYPNGSLQPADLAKPFEIVEIGDQWRFIVYVAAAYRTPDDPRPGIGIAWEPFPGLTPYTKDSEIMNAETSAWGRAIVAVLASESKAIASAEDVRNRRADADVMSDGPPGEEAPRPQRHSKSVASGGGTEATRLATEKQVGLIRGKLKDKGFKDSLPDGWEEAGLPGTFAGFPFSLVNTALEFIEGLPA